MDVLDRTKSWGRLEVHKVAAHQDTAELEKGVPKPWSQVTLTEWGNVLADAVVAENRGSGLLATVGPVAGGWHNGESAGRHPTQMRVGWGGRWATGTWKKEVTEHVRLQAHRAHMEQSTARHNEGREEACHAARDWVYSRSLKGAQWGARKARKEIQLLHGYLPTNRQMSRRECEDN